MKQGKHYKHKDGKDMIIHVHTIKEEQDHVAVGYDMFNIHWFEIVKGARPLYISSHMSNIKKEDLGNWKEYGL